tara:strand:+ start:304 stop:552 length:249 start_codon:yes stop_codon:yes gene_type:complete
MTIKELKEKIEVVENALEANAREGENKIFAEVAQISLIGLQAELIPALERELRDFFTVEQFEEIEAKQLGEALPWFVDGMRR